MSVKKKLFSSMLLALMITVLTVSNVFACSYKPNVDSSADCKNVTVTANPETVVTDGSGITREEWRPESIVGTGVFPWGNKVTMSGSVVVTWARWTSNSGGLFWTKTSSRDSNTTNWSEDLPKDCIQHTPVTLCHATPPDTAANGFNLITVDDDAVVKNGHDGEHSKDIIPAFTYWNGQTYPGKNLTTLYGWGATGQQILDNDCVIPPQPITNSASLTETNTCVGYAKSATFSAGGVLSGQIADTWKNPFVIEGPIPAGNVVVTWTSGAPLSITLPYAEFYEPSSYEGKSCQAIHNVTWKVEAVGCSGVNALFSVDGAAFVVYDTINWTSPYILENANFAPYNFPKNPGELYDFMQIPAQSAKEDAKCLNSHVITSGVSFEECKGWNAWYKIDDGEKVIYDQGTWNLPYGPETANVGEYDVPVPNNGEIYTPTHIDATTVTKDDSCIIVLDHSAKITHEDDCDKWSSDIAPSAGGIAVALTAESGTWSNPFVQEDFTVSYEVTWPDGYKETFSEKIVEDIACVNGVATADIQVSCGTAKVGSWMDVTIVSPHATVLIEGFTIHGTQTITLDNDKAPFNGVAIADPGYLFTNGSNEANFVIEKLGHCYVDPVRKECPTCGGHMDEVAKKENNVVWAMGSQDCVPCLVGKNYGYEVTGSYTFALRDIPFMALASVSEKTLKDANVPYVVEELGRHKIKGVFITSIPFEGLDKTYHLFYYPRELTHNTLTFYEMDGTPLINWGKDNQVDKYIPCSLTYGPWFVQKDGTMLLPTILNISDWDVIAWLVSAGYFPDTTEGWADAQKWLEPTPEAWFDIVKSGVIGPLPTK